MNSINTDKIIHENLRLYSPLIRYVATRDGFLHFQPQIWYLNVTLRTSVVDTSRNARFHTESFLPRHLVTESVTSNLTPHDGILLLRFDRCLGHVCKDLLKYYDR